MSSVLPADQALREAERPAPHGNLVGHVMTWASVTAIIPRDETSTERAFAGVALEVEP